MANLERPLSPHIQIYRWQINMVGSILHRATGIALSGGVLLLGWWLIALAAGPRAFATAQAAAGSVLGMLVLLGFTWALFYHLANGIRHLFWDTGHGFDLPTMRASGKAVVVASVALTVLAWILAFMWRA